MVLGQDESFARTRPLYGRKCWKEVQGPTVHPAAVSTLSSGASGSAIAFPGMGAHTRDSEHVQNQECREITQHKSLLPERLKIHYVR